MNTYPIQSVTIRIRGWQNNNSPPNTPVFSILFLLTCIGGHKLRAKCSTDSVNQDETYFYWNRFRDSEDRLWNQTLNCHRPQKNVTAKETGVGCKSDPNIVNIIVQSIHSDWPCISDLTLRWRSCFVNTGMTSRSAVCPSSLNKPFHAPSCTVNTFLYVPH